MGRRTKIEIYFNQHEQELLLAYYKYTKSLNQTTDLANTIFIYKHLPLKISRMSLRRWLEKTYPDVLRQILSEQRLKRKRKQQRASIKDFIIIKRRRLR